MEGGKAWFCRPKSNDEVRFYITSNTDTDFETGTEDYPFSNIAFAFMEVFNNKEKYEDHKIVIILD